MNDTQTAPAPARTGPAGCPPWCTGHDDQDEPGRIHRTARTAVDLPGHTGYLSTRRIEFHGQPPQAVVHGTRHDRGGTTQVSLYVPLAGAEDLAALLEFLAYATPDQLREIAAAIRAAAAAIGETDQ